MSTGSAANPPGFRPVSPTSGASTRKSADTESHDGADADHRVLHHVTPTAKNLPNPGTIDPKNNPVGTSSAELSVGPTEDTLTLSPKPFKLSKSVWNLVDKAIEFERLNENPHTKNKRLAKKLGISLRVFEAKQKAIVPKEMRLRISRLREDVSDRATYLKLRDSFHDFWFRQLEEQKKELEEQKKELE
ncbi:MAG: hypothetical protein AAGI66_09240, partial [Cyanobacteria bacterium P01_H01_bin.74]